jgi:excisionase family DNA binding protein
MRKGGDTVGVRDAAIMLGFTMKYVYDLVLLGRLPAKKVGRKWRIPRRAVEERAKLTLPSD